MRLRSFSICVTLQPRQSLRVWSDLSDFFDLVALHRGSWLKEELIQDLLVFALFIRQIKLSVLVVVNLSWLFLVPPHLHNWVKILVFLALIVLLRRAARQEPADAPALA